MGSPTGVSGASIVELLGDGGNPIELTKASAQALEKGDVLGLADVRTGFLVDTASAAQVFGGIVASEVTTAEAKNHVGVYTYGIFDMYAGGAITAGSLVVVSGGNLIHAIDTTTPENQIRDGKIVGKALETATKGEKIEVLVGAHG